MGFVFTLLSNLRTGFFPSLCKYFSLSIPLLLPFLPASLPQLPPDRTPLTFLPSNLQASHICIFSFTSFYCAKGGGLLLPYVKPFPRALDPFLSHSQYPTPVSFSTPFLHTSLFLTLYSQRSFLTELSLYAISTSSPFMNFPTHSDIVTTLPHTY